MEDDGTSSGEQSYNEFKIFLFKNNNNLYYPKIKKQWKSKAKDSVFFMKIQLRFLPLNKMTLRYNGQKKQS